MQQEINVFVHKFHLVTTPNLGIFTIRDTLQTQLIRQWVWLLCTLAYNDSNDNFNRDYQ